MVREELALTAEATPLLGLCPCGPQGSTQRPLWQEGRLELEGLGPPPLLCLASCPVPPLRDKGGGWILSACIQPHIQQHNQWPPVTGSASTRASLFTCRSWLSVVELPLEVVELSVELSVGCRSLSSQWELNDRQPTEVSSPSTINSHDRQ